MTDIQLRYKCKIKKFDIFIFLFLHNKHNYIVVKYENLYGAFLLHHVDTHLEVPGCEYSLKEPQQRHFLLVPTTNMFMEK